MVQKITITRQPAGLEDLAIGMSTQAQTRNGVPVTVTELNATNITFNGTDSIADILDVGTGPNQLLRLNGSAQIPAVDGSLLIGLPSGVNQFKNLLDVPNTYTGNTLKLLRCNAGETALEYVTPGALYLLNTVAATQIDANAVITTKILNNNVTLAKLATIADMRVIGNTSGSPATPTEVEILDEDAMGSDSDTKLATQQSIKAYVNSITTFLSSLFRIKDFTDATKQLAFNLVALTTGTTRTIIMPDADVDLSKLGSLVPISETIISGAPTTVDISSGIDGTYDSYFIDIVDLVPTNASDYLQMRISTDGGSTFKSGASDYAFHLDDSYVTAATYSGVASAGNPEVRLATLIGGASTDSTNVQLVLHTPSDAAAYFTCDWKGNSVRVATGLHRKADGMGVYNAIAAVDAIQLILAINTFASGTVRLYGISKS